MEYGSTLKKYINVLIHEGASDLHMSAGLYPTIRVSGALAPMLKEPSLNPEDTVGFIKELMTSDKYKEFVANQEMDFAYEGEGVRFRGNAFFQKGSSAIALRLIPKKIRTIQELNLPEILLSFARKTQGFFLV